MAKSNLNLEKLKVNFKIRLEKFRASTARLDFKKFKGRFFIIILVLVVAALILTKTWGNIRRVLFKEKVRPPAVAFEEGLVPVKVLKVKKVDFKDTLPVMGNIKGFREIDLKFQVNGIIESINFEEGERIQEGDIIANLVQKEALLKLKYSELELKKSRKLHEMGAIIKMKLDQTKLEYESARTDLDKTNLYAVSDGLMGSRLIDVGNFVTPNDKIGVFIDIRKVYAEFSVIEKDIPKVSLRQKVDVFVDAFPKELFHGEIDRIAPIVEGRSRTQTIKVELDNKEGSLKPGMFTRALIYTYEKKDALVIPSSSLKKKETEYFVYIVYKEEKPSEEATETQETEEKAGEPIETGTIEVRRIELGYMTQDLVEVEKGIKEDELVMVEVYEEFKDKTKVEILEVQESIF